MAKAAIPPDDRSLMGGGLLPGAVLGLRPKEAARAIGVSDRKLWEITADRDSGIPHVRFGGCIVYPARALADWLDEQARKAVRR